MTIWLKRYDAPAIPLLLRLLAMPCADCGGHLPVRSKNSKSLTAAEREHIERVKSLDCSVCGAAGPSDAHHIEQGKHFITVALCKECHQGSFLGWHGQKRAWTIRKMDELDALNETIRRLA